MAGPIDAGRMPVQQAKNAGEDLSRRPQFEWLARAGLAARGIIYAIVGVLAVKVALGGSGKETDQQGALKTIADQPFGKALLGLMAIGLFGYAMWRLIRAALGHGLETGRDDTKDRLAGVASGLIYSVLLFTALKILLGGGGGSGQGEDKATGGVLGWPGGTWIVGIAGLVVIGVGIDQAIKGIKKKFLDDSKTEQMSPEVLRGFTGVGVFGHLARAVVFALIGYFLVRAAIDYDPDKAIGLDGALAKLGDASYGPVLLGIVAVGLIGFAVYSAMDARYRRV